MNVHRTDAVSLVFGLIFLLIVAGWLFGFEFNVPLPRFGWIAAGRLIAAGVIGLFRALRVDRRRDETDNRL